jgi:hypothetical protein
VVQSKSKASDDNLIDNNPVLPDFNVAEFEIICRTSSQLQSCWPDLGKSDCPVWYFGWSGFRAPLMSALPSLYLAMRISKVAFGHRCGLPSSFFCHWLSFGLFGSHSSPMTMSLPLIISARDSRTRTFFPSSLTMFLFVGNESLSSFIWGPSANFNYPSFMAD